MINAPGHKSIRKTKPGAAPIPKWAEECIEQILPDLEFAQGLLAKSKLYKHGGDNARVAISAYRKCIKIIWTVGEAEMLRDAK